MPPVPSALSLEYATFAVVSVMLFACLQAAFWKQRGPRVSRLAAWLILGFVLAAGALAAASLPADAPQRFAIFSAAGAMVFGVGVLQSIGVMAAVNEETRQRHAEADAAAAARARLSGLVHSIDAILYEWQPEPPAYRFLSDQTERLLGYAPTCCEGESDFLTDRIHAEDRPAVVDARQRALELDRPFRMEYRIAAADGRTLWLLECGQPSADAEGRPLLRGILQDITARRLAAAEMEHLHRELVEASRRAGMAEVATGVLHNVGNVLNSVNVSCSLIAESLTKSRLSNLARTAEILRSEQRRLVDFLTQDQRGRLLPRYLGQLASGLAAEHESLRTEVARLAAGIDHLREIVRLQQDAAVEPDRDELVPLKDAVEHALLLCGDAIVREGITLHRHFPAGDPAIVGHRHRLIQIIVNLVRNAAAALADNPPGLRRVDIAIAPAGDRLRLTVRDNGAGIPAAHLTRIFSHGFSTRRDGHGFGLHSSALAARRLGGDLTAASAGPGTGAVFTLDLPAAHADSHSSPTRSLSSAPSAAHA